jgi:hypothetical protein
MTNAAIIKNPQQHPKNSVTKLIIPKIKEAGSAESFLLIT